MLAKTVLKLDGRGASGAREKVCRRNTDHQDIRDAAAAAKMLRPHNQPLPPPRVGASPARLKATQSWGSWEKMRGTTSREEAELRGWRAVKG